MLTAEEWSVLGLSLRVAVAGVALMLPPGIVIAWLLARSRIRGKLVLDALVHLPLVLPPVVVGFVLLRLLGRKSYLGAALNTVGIEVAFTTKAAAIAAAVMAFPLLVRSIRLAIELVDPRLEQAARTLGAGPLRVFLTITLPLAAPGILTGVVLGFARSLGEFGATITFAGNIEGVTRTLPSAIFTYMQSPGGDAPAMRLVILSVLVSLAALAGSEGSARVLKRRLGGGE
ncbi:MAG: Molybdenum transport system permease protein ModB [Phycisphaerae bacterium]|nr:Molybdenum transport system permease protein ModB [Phycisphaerae bacterium]